MAYPWSANDILTAADLNAAIGTGIVSTGLGAWSSYTPAWTASGTAPAIGNGTISGRYMKTGRWVRFGIRMVCGSTTTFGTGTYSWSTPDTMDTTLGNNPGFLATILDASVPTRFMRTGIIASGTTIQFFSEAGTAVGQTSPMTWTNGDIIIIAGDYESTT